MTAENLAHFYQGWHVDQAHLVTIVSPLTVEQMAIKPAPHMWSLGTLIGHIVSARAWWFHGVMGEGGTEYETYYPWDEAEFVAQTPAELVGGLEATWQLMHACLDRWTPADLDTVITHPSRGTQLSRQWIIWHVIEHDLVHMGEIMLIGGIHEMAKPDL